MSDPTTTLTPAALALDVAHQAARTVGGDHWWCNAPPHDGAPTVDPPAELAAFLREFPGAPAEAAYIRGGALGVHDGAVRWGELAPPVRLGYQVFAGVLRLLDTELARAAEAERQAAIARQAPAAIEDTIFERDGGGGDKLDELRPRKVPKGAVWSDADQAWAHPDGRRWTAGGKRIKG